MNEHPLLPPEQCSSMREVRAGVDTVDRQLVALLGTRFAYMRAAARIKRKRDEVRDEGRKAEVVANVARAGAALDLPAPVVAALWETLVEASIAYEMEEWERLNG